MDCPTAIRFGVTLGDENKKPIDLHDIIKAKYVLSDTAIKSGETRSIEYQLPIDQDPRAKVEVRLLYRSVPQSFLNHFMTSDLRFQIIEMATAALQLDSPARCGTGGPSISLH